MHEHNKGSKSPLILFSGPEFFYPPIQVLIPVHGSQTAGQLRSNATHRQGKWELDLVQLEFKGRPEVVVIVDRTNKSKEMETVQSVTS